MDDFRFALRIILAAILIAATGLLAVPAVQASPDAMPMLHGAASVQTMGMSDAGVGCLGHCSAPAGSCATVCVSTAVLPGVDLPHEPVYAPTVWSEVIAVFPTDFSPSADNPPPKPELTEAQPR